MISSSNVRCASDRHASERDQYSGLPMTLTEMPSSLKRRIVGLAAIVGVIFLINFPSSTAAVCVIGLLSVGILYSLLEESKQSEEGLVQNRSTQLNRANIQAALKKYSQDAEKRFGPGQAPAAHESKAGPDKYTNAQENHATNFARTVIPQSNNTVAEQNQSQSTFNMQRAGHAPDQIASRNEAVKLGKGSSSERYVPNGLAEAIPVVKNGKVEDKPNQPNGKSGGPPLAGGAAVLARLRQQRAQSQIKVIKEEKQEVIFAYASQTGTAQEIAKTLHAESSSHSIKSKVLSLNELGFENLVSMQSPLLVIVASSTGDGDSPDNAAKFYATMRRKTQQPGILKNVKFTTLGLGDSNYTRFMGVSRAIRTRMQDLGAVMFYQHAEADEVDGLESVIDPWTEGLWPILQNLVKQSSAKVTANGSAHVIGNSQVENVPALPPCRIEVRWIENATDTADGSRENPSEDGLRFRDAEGLYSSTQPFWAEVTDAKYLTARSSDRKVIHMAVNLSGSGMKYQPGDSLGVMPQNDLKLVEKVIKRLHLDAEKKFEIRAKDGDEGALLSHLGWPCTVKDALQCGCDLTSAPRKSLLRLLAEFCTVTTEKEGLLRLCSKEGKEDYKALMSPHPPSILDLLQQFPSCNPPLADLLDALPPLMPRLYSISSSPLRYPDEAHFALSVVRLGYPLPNLRISDVLQQNGNGIHKEEVGVTSRWGVATGWLERQVAPILEGKSHGAIRIPIHLKRGGSFGHPADLEHPMLMIGPGTGVAPFRGFLQHREALLKSRPRLAGKSILYFGCRRQDEDYLYGDEFQEFKQGNVLDKLEVAFSRKSEEKIYVQHLMLSQAEEVADLLRHKEAHVFVCGDGSQMAKDVHEALLKILETEDNLSPAEATSKLMAMTKAGRYIRDIWS